LHRRCLSRVTSLVVLTCLLAAAPVVLHAASTRCYLVTRMSIPSGMGLTLTFDDFREVLATPGRIFAGFALQYTIMPAMAFAVSRLMGLPLAFTIG